MSFLILFFDVLVAVVLVILVVATHFDASHFFGYVCKLHSETAASVLAGGGGSVAGVLAGGGGGAAAGVFAGGGGGGAAAGVLAGVDILLVSLFHFGKRR